MSHPDTCVSLCILQCAPGYVGSTGVKVTCLQGQWQGLPTCGCPKPDASLRLQYDSSSCNWANTPVGSSCSIAVCATACVGPP